MSGKISPLAPKSWKSLPPIDGVRLGSVEAGIKYKGSKDLTAIIFDKPAGVAGVFTNSKCPSAAVDWCRKHLGKGVARAVIINSGNANAFTGKKGIAAVKQTAKAASDVFKCKQFEVFLASTGVIGEPLETAAFQEKLIEAQKVASDLGWDDAAKAIMTTDTYHKTASEIFNFNGVEYVINGIAKGSGMIAPDMATMLSFAVTNFPLESKILQRALSKAIRTSFNSVSVDSDTSTSDTVLLFSIGKEKVSAAAVKAFEAALSKLMLSLAMDVVRDGEGASKHIKIDVEGAKSNGSARKIAMSIANSPLVKTAIAGEDANWGRIVMAVGKAGEPADRDLLSIWFGDVRVAHKGERDPKYDEAATSMIMQEDFIPIKVDIGLGKGKSTVWTCDLTHEYISINADYRS